MQNLNRRGMLAIALLMLIPGSLVSQHNAPCQKEPAYRNHRLGLVDCNGRFTSLKMPATSLSQEEVGADPKQILDSNELKLVHAQADFRIWQYRFTRHVYEVQYWTTFVIFFFSMAVVAAGLWFSWLQFRIAHQVGHLISERHPAAGLDQEAPDSKDRPLPSPQEELQITRKGIVVRSSYLGVIILTLSMVFLFLYLKFVYPISAN